MMFTNILQDKNIFFMLTKVTLMFMQKALQTQVQTGCKNYFFCCLFTILVYVYHYALYCNCIQFRAEPGKM